ncbi:hypothetical protein [Gemmobacter denitrificans]|uniref:Uncharacterized protein n=1 Tax=Gemmobacter denitrificans TaxID=3123040 RepID=A0ABU8BSI8_9RHOB
MTNKLDIWNAHADIDPKFTKAITGKAYKGTSPNPQYVIYCLTQLFGPVGQGFGWRVLAEGFEHMGSEVLHWCRIEFWHTDKANGYESYGQTRAAYNTSGGKYMVDEDAPKKSLTDAIVKAASHLGIAANIFLGRWDDSKYVAEVAAAYQSDSAPASSPATQAKPPQSKPAARDWQKVQANMMDAIKNIGLIVCNDNNFKRDLAAMKSAAPELASHVEAEINTKREAEAA